jgi:hypothetical protein
MLPLGTIFYIDTSALGAGQNIYVSPRVGGSGANLISGSPWTDISYAAIQGVYAAFSAGTASFYNLQNRNLLSNVNSYCVCTLVGHDPNGFGYWLIQRYTNSNILPIAI